MNRGKSQTHLWAKLSQAIRGESRVLLTSAGVAGCVILLRLVGWFQAWELAALDQGFRLRPLEPVDERIVIVGIDEADLQRIRKYPIPDRAMAQLLQKIQTYQPRAIGLDIYRDLPVEPGHQALEQVFQTSPNLIGIQKIKDESNPGIPAPPILKQQSQVGFNNLVFDVDSKVRRGLLYWGKNESFALKIALIYLQAKGISPEAAASDRRYLQLGKAVFRILEPNDGAYTNIDARGYQFLANLRGSAKRFRTISMIDVLEGRVKADSLRDRIVLIGSTAESLKDYFYTSYSGGSISSNSPEPTSGVELQANLISQIISAAMEGRPLIQVWSEPGEWLWIIVWSWLGAALSWRLRSPLKSTGALLLAGGGLTGTCYAAFLAGWWLPIVPPAIAAAGSAMVIISHIAHIKEELKRSKEFLNSIINAIPDPVFVKDKTHRWIVLNQAYSRFLGYPLEELLGKSDYDVFSQQEADILHQQDQQVFSHAQEQEAEASFTNQEGVTRQIATKRSLHKDAAGNLFLVGVIRDITERKQMEEELKRTAAELVRSNQELQQSANRLHHQAMHDTLTGLPNRQLFEDRFHQALEWAVVNEQLVGLLFLDLDGFKSINDTLGHDVGDLLLKAVAQRLTRCLRGSDTVSRLGGDEFTVVLPAIPSSQDAAKVAEKILTTLAQPFKLGEQEHTIFVTTSIGISLYPQDGAEVESLVKSADTAMYQAKQLGKNRYQFASEI